MGSKSMSIFSKVSIERKEACRNVALSKRLYIAHEAFQLHIREWESKTCTALAKAIIIMEAFSPPAHPLL